MLRPHELGNNPCTEVIRIRVSCSGVIQGTPKNAHVERSIMGDQRSGHDGPEAGPELREGRRVGDIRRRDAVYGNIKRIEAQGVGPYQLPQLPDDFAVLDHHQANRAS